MEPLEQRLKQQARQLGFELAGIAAATAADTFAAFSAWLDQGHAGAMHYLLRHKDAHRQPQSVLPEVRSVIMVGRSYKPAASSEQLANGVPGQVARYARGADYHDVLRRHLLSLLAWLQGEQPHCRGRAVVDTAPLLERDFARRAGLGWFGKNTMLIDKRLGSYFFLGALLVDLELQPDAAHDARHCGSCTACLDACPTDAFPTSYQLDARRCISYLTIELRGPVPVELRPGVGDWLFGCDVCQEVCPWNRKAPAGSDPELQGPPGLAALDALAVLALTEEEYQRRFRGTALTRAKRSGLVRNAAVVLGNCGDARALPALRRALDDPEPTVRDAAAWAIAAIERRCGCATLPESSTSVKPFPQGEDTCLPP
jgi:epoxyqueuosine reductase